MCQDDCKVAIKQNEPPRTPRRTSLKIPLASISLALLAVKYHDYAFLLVSVLDPWTFCGISVRLKTACGVLGIVEEGHLCMFCDS